MIRHHFPAARLTDCPLPAHLAPVLDDLRASIKAHRVPSGYRLEYILQQLAAATSPDSDFGQIAACFVTQDQAQGQTNAETGAIMAEEALELFDAATEKARDNMAHLSAELWKEVA